MGCETHSDKHIFALVYQSLNQIYNSIESSNKSLIVPFESSPEDIKKPNE